MTIELIKQLMDTCYLAKRARDLLPPLPDGVTSSYIQYLDVIQRLEAKGVRARVSDLSDALNLPRPGVTRTVKEMERKGYLRREPNPTDGRSQLLYPTEQAEGLRNAKAEAESAFYNYLMDGLDEPTREAFLQTLDVVYRRSKAESRAGFPHVKEAMEEAQHGTEA